MNKEAFNCKHGVTQQCPHRNEKPMLDLFAVVGGNKTQTHEMLDSAKAICNKCDKFTPED